MRSLLTKLTALCLLLTLCHCAALKKQTAELLALKNCQYRIGAVNNVALAGINVSSINNIGQLNIMQVGSLASTYLQKKMPLSLTVNLDVKNPGTVKAALNKTDWIMFIDGKQMVNGTSTGRVEVPANNGTGTLPLNMTVDLFQLLNKESKDNIIKFALGLAGQGNANTRVTLKIKPTFLFNNQSIELPNYITVNGNFK